MGVSLGLVSHDNVFKSLIGKEPIIINDLPCFSKFDRERLEETIYTTYDVDLLSNIPSCECGETTGAYNLGEICQHCRTPVESILDQDLQPLTWMRAPKGVRALINPSVWKILKSVFKVKQFSIAGWLCDTRYQFDGAPPPILNDVLLIKIKGEPIKRGYNYFIDNFDEILEALANIPHFRTKQGGREKVVQLIELVKMYRDCVFSQYMPMPHRSLLIKEENNLGNYADKISTEAINAILVIAGIDTDYTIYSQSLRENRTIKAVDQISDFYEATDRESFAAKSGVFRKHVYATRSNFSFRTVVSSITAPHRIDEIHIPWGVATSVFRIHLMSKLTRLGYTPNEGISFINEHAEKYSPLLDSLFQELINEASGGKGVCATINRNPSLHRSSMQRCYITQVKKDPMIPTTSIGILIVRGMNCDFDGKRICCH